MILIIGGAAVSLFDKFVLHKWHSQSESKKHSSLAATDRLIAYVLIFGSIFSYLIWHDTQSTVEVMSIFLPFLILLGFLIGQRNVGLTQKKKDTIKRQEKIDSKQPGPSSVTVPN
ncbi:MAG: hypothetical protein WA137_11110 [Methanothrix sp.]